MPPTLRPLFVVVVLLSAVFGCDLLDPNPGPDAVGVATGGTFEDIEPPSAAKGLDLYATYCSRCHGENAVGSELWPAPLWGYTGIAPIIKEGKDSMPAFTVLSDSQIVSIELYLGALATMSDAASGVELFDLYCAGCHGAEAAGGPFFPSSIQGFEPIGEIVRDGRNEMPAFEADRLSEAQIDSIQAYVSSVGDLSSLTGEQYYVARCAGCHGFDAFGSDRGYPVKLPVRAYAAYVIRAGRPGQPFADSMPAYSTDHLSDQQLNELLDYLEAFGKPTDGAGLYATFCGNCHGPDGLGGISGSDLRDDDADLQEFLDKVREGEDAPFAIRTAYMPAWPASEISDADVQAIIDFLASFGG